MGIFSSFIYIHAWNSTYIFRWNWIRIKKKTSPRRDPGRILDVFIHLNLNSGVPVDGWLEFGGSERAARVARALVPRRRRWRLHRRLPAAHPRAALCSAQRLGRPGRHRDGHRRHQPQATGNGKEKKREKKREPFPWRKYSSVLNAVFFFVRTRRCCWWWNRRWLCAAVESRLTPAACTSSTWRHSGSPSRPAFESGCIRYPLHHLYNRIQSMAANGTW